MAKSVNDLVLDASGRKLTVAAKNSVPVDASGDATHVALVDGTNLLYVTTYTTQTFRVHDNL